MTNTLHLVLTRQWFDMIASGVKKEEYRQMTDHWVKRLVQGGIEAFCAIPGVPESPYVDSGGYSFKPFTTVTFQHGYAKNAPRMVVECKGIRIGTGRPEWGAKGENYFVIELGRIIAYGNPSTGYIPIKTTTTCS